MGLGDAQVRDRATGAVIGVALEQVVERGLEDLGADDADAFRRAAGEDLAPQLGPGHQPHRRVAHRLEAAQLKGEASRHLGTAGLVVVTIACFGQRMKTEAQTTIYS